MKKKQSFREKAYKNVVGSVVQLKRLRLFKNNYSEKR